VCTVPQNKSIACSTEKAIEWDEAFKKNADESGRAVNVHVETTKNP
jgi:asparagine synthase (glutamine-hydrolysing)